MVGLRVFAVAPEQFVEVARPGVCLVVVAQQQIVVGGGDHAHDGTGVVGDAVVLVEHLQVFLIGFGKDAGRLFRIAEAQLAAGYGGEQAGIVGVCVVAFLLHHLQYGHTGSHGRLVVAFQQQHACQAAGRHGVVLHVLVAFHVDGQCLLPVVLGHALLAHARAGIALPVAGLHGREGSLFLELVGQRQQLLVVACLVDGVHHAVGLDGDAYGSCLLVARHKAEHGNEGHDDDDGF